MYEQKELLEKYKPILVTIIQKYFPSCKIYLFGSRARGTNLEGADIDLAIDVDGSPAEYKKILMIYSDIDDTTIPVFVDVVDIAGASELLKSEIERDGILWTN